MAHKVDAIRDVLNKIASIQITNHDGRVVAPTVRMWNDQVAMLETGKEVAIVLPAFFLEIANSQVYEILGQGYRSCDLVFKVHVVDEFYDDMAGHFEQDLTIFALGDLLTATLTYFNPSGCGPLVGMQDEMDYNHGNVNHHIYSYGCNFTDSAGSRTDAGRTDYQNTTPPTALDLQASFLYPPIIKPQPDS